MVSDRIFPLFASKDTSGDFIIYSRYKYTRIRNNMGYLEECQILIVVGSDNYDRSQLLAEYISNSLEGNKVDGVIYQSSLLDSTEDYESDLYLQILLFEIK